MNEKEAREEVFVEEVAVEGAPARPDRFLPISILVAGGLVAGAVLFSTLYHPGTTQAPAGDAGGNANAPANAPVAAIMNLGPRDVVLGNANAKVTVVEYGDYQCPFCTLFHAQIQPAIIKNYVDTGKVKFVFRDFPFLDRFAGLPAGSNESHDAGNAAECAKDQNKFWEYHDALYNAKAGDEAKGGGENDGFYNRTLFMNIASQLKMDTQKFAQCIDNKQYATLLNDNYAAASAAGVNSTPAVFVNGVKVVDSQGQSVGANGPVIFAAIDAALK